MSFGQLGFAALLVYVATLAGIAEVARRARAHGDRGGSILIRLLEVSSGAGIIY